MLPQKSELEQRIVELLRQKGNRLLSSGEVHERLGDPEIQRDTVERAVDDLEGDGVIVPVRGKHYSLLEFTPYHAGRIKVHPDGYGTVFGGDDPDIYVDRKSMKGAMSGDLVVVRADKRNPKFKRIHNRDLINGEVVKVLKRAHQTVVGRFHEGPTPFVVPYDFRIDTDIVIDNPE